METPGNTTARQTHLGVVNDISDTRKPIKRREPHQAYKTLGVFLAPDGNPSQQYDKMLSAATIWADSMRTGCISKEEVWIAL